MTDALLSPIGFSILSGAHLFKDHKDAQTVHFHMTTLATAKKDGTVDLSDAIAEYGNEAKLCTEDAPIYVMAVEEDGSITGTVYSATAEGNVLTITFGEDAKNHNVMIDYYIDLPGKEVYEADITADTFAGYYYVEADTLFRDQATGKDMPANLTLPNVKLQSNFTITMASTGDPSTFDFVMDAFPGFTYFDHTKKVLCVLQVVPNKVEKNDDRPVMPHTDTKENEAIFEHDSKN